VQQPDIRGLEEWRLLARGRLAVVWEARQPSLGRVVAVKVYDRSLDEDAQHEFLRRTARAAQLANHPGIGTVHDAGVLPGGRPYLVAGLRAGGSVAAWLDRGSRRDVGRVRQVGAVIADALATAHAAGVVHGSVKPTNILIGDYDDPVLVDFAAAVVRDAEPSSVSEDLAYAAPEARGGAARDASGDVYSLAAVVYALLSAGPPFASSAQAERARRRAVPPLADVDTSLNALLRAALDRDPAVRPTAAELRDGLLAGPSTVIPAPAAGPMTHADRPRGRVLSRGRVLAAVALLVVVGSAGAWLAGDPGSSGVPATGSPVSTAAASASPPVATPGAEGNSGPGTQGDARIELMEPAGSAKPFEAVQLSGTFTGGRSSTFLQVQRLEGGTWRSFPLPTRADRTGQFTTFVELGQPGRYPLRVLDPESGATSGTVVLVVRA
jgi:serine/threonine protein kinase